MTLLCVLAYIPYIYIKQFITVLNYWETAFATISPHASLGMGMLVLADLQSKRDRRGWVNLFPDRNHDARKVNLGWIYISLMLTGLAQMIATIYISHVFPEKGMPKLPWNFMFKVNIILPHFT